MIERDHAEILRRLGVLNEATNLPAASLEDKKRIAYTVSDEQRLLFRIERLADIFSVSLTAVGHQ